jgi:hypothetical protein
MHKKVPCVVLTMLLVGAPAVAFATCENVNAPETVSWSGKLLSALAEDQACSQASSDDAFAATNACNIFVGRVLQKVYNISDFVVTPARPQQPFYSANEIATLLQSGVWDGWAEIGTADSQDVLSQAKQAADSGKLVLAVWQNPDANSSGHVALIGPGPLTPSGTWGVNTPVSASFVLNQPQKAFLGQPLSCAFGSDKKSAVHIWVKGS